MERRCSATSSALTCERSKDLCDVVVGFEWVTERPVQPHFVDVVATLFVTNHIAGFDQVRDDAMDSSLADSHQSSHVDEPNFGVLCDAQQNVGVIGEECPRGDLGVSALGAEFHGVTLLLIEICRTD